MSKQVSATDAKNNFGGLLDAVATLGRVDIVKHGRLVAVVLAPRLAPREPVGSSVEASRVDAGQEAWGATHMIRGEQARTARMVRPPRGFDED